jgi:hypothetical protein
MNQTRHKNQRILLVLANSRRLLGRSPFTWATVAWATVAWATAVSPAISQDAGSSFAEQLQARLSPDGKGKTNQNPAPAGSAGSTMRSGAAGERADSKVFSPGMRFGQPPFDLRSLNPLFAEPTPLADQDTTPVLKGESEQAYLAGAQTTAVKLMFGHMAAEFDEAHPVIQSVKYSRLLKRPVWNVRFGVSLSVRESGTDGEDPAPIPLDQTQRNATAAAPAALDRNGPDRNGPDREGMANDFARALQSRIGSNPKPRRPVERTRDRRTSSAREAAEVDESNPTGAATEAASATPSAAPNLTTDEVQAEFNRTLGLVAQVVAEEFAVRYNRGDFGMPMVTSQASAVPSTDAPAATATESKPTSGFESLSNLAGLRPPPQANAAPTGPAPAGSAPTGPAAAGPAAAGPAAAAAQTTFNRGEGRPIWQPGIFYIGNGSAKEMIAQAAAADIDLLLHFEVALKPGRGNEVQNSSRLRLITVSDAKTIALSKSMDSYEESQLSTKGVGGGRDYVSERIENLFGIIDRDVNLTELPPLTAEIVRRRLGQLLGSEPPRSLRTLAEVRLYQLKSLLTPEEVELAFEIVGGSDGLLMLYGPQEERIAIARQWALAP